MFWSQTFLKKSDTSTAFIIAIFEIFFSLEHYKYSILKKFAVVTKMLYTNNPIFQRSYNLISILVPILYMVPRKQ